MKSRRMVSRSLHGLSRNPFLNNFLTHCCRALFRYVVRPRGAHPYREVLLDLPSTYEEGCRQRCKNQENLNAHHFFMIRRNSSDIRADAGCRKMPTKYTKPRTNAFGRKPGARGCSLQVWPISPYHFCEAYLDKGNICVPLT
jgi:hypothetical protein